MTYEEDGRLMSESEQAFRDSVRKKMKIGGILFIALLLVPVYIFFGQNTMPFDFMVATSVILGFIGFLGIMTLLIYGQGSSLLYRCVKTIKKLAPPDPVFVEKFAVMNKDPVYVLAQWGIYAIRFIGFHHAETTFEHKTKIPGLITRWEYNYKIGAFKVARREGKFTIPVDEASYITGDGILYSLLLSRPGFSALPRDLSKEQLEMIIAHLTEDLGKDDTSLSDFADFGDEF